jgi:hypothetical protein
MIAMRGKTLVACRSCRVATVPRTRPTLAVISCTPYWVDSQRVVVIAQMR